MQRRPARAQNRVLRLTPVDAVERPHVLRGRLLRGDETGQAGDRGPVRRRVVGDPLGTRVEGGDVVLDRGVGRRVAGAPARGPAARSPARRRAALRGPAARRGGPAAGRPRGRSPARGSAARRCPAARGAAGAAPRLHARHLRRARRVGEGRGGQEVVEGLLDHPHHVVVVAAGQVHAVGGLLQGQRPAVAVDEPDAVDPGRVGGGQVLGVGPGPRARGARAGGGELAHVPLVGGVGLVQARDRAPAHGAGDGVGQGGAVGTRSGGAQGGQVGRVEVGVARGAHDGGLGAAAGVPEDVHLLGVSRQRGGVVAQEAHGGLEIGHAPRGVAGGGLGGRVLAAQPGVDVDEPRLHVGGHRVGGVLGQRLLGRVAGGVDRQHEGRGGARVVARGTARGGREGEGAVTVVRGGDVGAGDEDGQGLVAGVLRGRGVGQADLVVDVGVGVMGPGGGVQGQRGVRGGQGRGGARGRGGAAGAAGAGGDGSQDRGEGDGPKDEASGDGHGGPFCRSGLFGRLVCGSGLFRLVGVCAGAVGAVDAPRVDRL